MFVSSTESKDVDGVNLLGLGIRLLENFKFNIVYLPKGVHDRNNLGLEGPASESAWRKPAKWFPTN